MKKRLSVSDIILLSIAGIFDFFQAIKDPGGLISNYYQNFYGFVPHRWQKTNIYKVIHMNRKQKRLIKINKKFLLTPQGENHLKTNFPLVFFRIKKWGGYFHFIFFDVMELKRTVRDRLRSLLKQLNFALLQKSVWITHNSKLIKPILEFKQNYNLNKEILIIKAKFSSNKDLCPLINQLWRLDDLNKEYQRIFRQYQDLLTQYKKEKNFPFFLERFSQINRNFYQITIKDPFFPPSLLPKKWFYFEGLKIKKEIARIIKAKKQNI